MRQIAGQFAAMVAGVLMTVATTSAEDHAQENAALSYWQAIALMPEAGEREHDVFDNWEQIRLDPEIEQFVDRGRGALDLLRRGSQMESCYWGSALEEGPGTLLPHLSKSRQLARLACLRARVRFASGKPLEALEDLHAVMVLARHLGGERLLISVLVQFGIERMGCELTAAHLPAIPQQHLAELRESIQSLPSRGTIQQGIEGERTLMGGWLRRAVLEALERGDDPKDLQAHIASLLGSEVAEAFTVDTIEVNDLRRWLDDLDTYYDAMVASFDQSLPQRESAWNDLEQRIQRSSNPLVKLLLPAIRTASRAEIAAEIRADLLLAAIDIADGGKARLKDHRDPAGDGPFTFHEAPGGYELRSAFQHRDKPVSLRIGRPSKP